VGESFLGSFEGEKAENEGSKKGRIGREVEEG